jgi:signal transduction histidine kinase/DNA-binding NarL/FixJ family response regulator
VPSGSTSVPQAPIVAINRMLWEAPDGTHYLVDEGGWVRQYAPDSDTWTVLGHAGKTSSWSPGVPLSPSGPTTVVVRDGELWTVGKHVLTHVQADGTRQQVHLPMPRPMLLIDAEGSLHVVGADAVFRLEDLDLVPVEAPLKLGGERWQTQGRRLYRGTDLVFTGTSNLNLLIEEDDGVWLSDELAGLVFVHRSPVSAHQEDALGPLGIVDAVLSDTHGGLWIGSREGLRRWIDGEPQWVLDTDGAPVKQSLSLLERHSGEVLVSTQNGGCVVHELPRKDALHCRAPATLSFPGDAQVMLEGLGHAVWLASGELFRSRPGVSLERVIDMESWHPFRALAETSDGGVLASAIGVGLYLIREDETLLRDDEQGSPLRVVRAILLDERGDAWLGTEGHGLCRLELSRNQPFERIPLICLSEKHGLTDGFVNSIANDGRGRLWLSSNSGLQGLSWDDLRDVLEGRATTLTVLTFGETEGMAEPETNGVRKPSVTQSPDGSLWYPTMNGVAHLDSRDVTFPMPPAVILEDLRTPIRPLDPDQGDLIVRPDEREAFTRQDSLRFRYRLSGLDEDWRGPTTDRRATWNNLPPGTYTLEIQSGWGGRWRPPATYATVVVPPVFRETHWFVVSVSLATLLLAGGLFLIWVRQARLRERELQDAVEGATADIAARNQRLIAQAEILTEQREILAEQARVLEDRNTRIAAQAEILQERNARIAAQAERLDQLDKIRTRFVANISHELRTPLTLIRGTIDDLVTSSEVPRGLLMAQRNAARLSELVEQLLDVARMDADGVPLRARRMDLGRFLGRVAAAFEEAARAGGVDLRLELPAGVEVWGDPDLLEKVFTNLLANGLDYCPAGGWLRLTLVVEGDEDVAQAVIRVVDTGPGVPHELRERLFERFFQADDSDRRSRGGAGIGLSLASEFVALHGGEISILDEPDAGAVFEVRLPLGAAHLSLEEISMEAGEPEPTIQRPVSTSPSPRADAGSDDDDRRPVVLLVEDHPDMRAYMAEHLSGSFRVVEAVDGQEALERLHAGLRPELVVSDVMMPRLDGLALCRMLRGSPSTADLPILLVSAKATEADQEAGSALASAYMVKPFRSAELVSQARALVPEARWPQEPREPHEEDGPTVPDADATVDVGPFLRRLTAIADAHLSDPAFGTSQLARKAALSPRQLLRRVQDSTGQSTAVWLRDRRLKRARELMQRGEVETVGEAAAAVGMSRAYFSRVYSDWAGHAPSEDLPQDR